MTPLALLAMAGCLAVNPASDRILARDFAPAWSALGSLPPDTEIGLAPAPGVPRVFSPLDLRRVAARFHVAPVPQSSICFERRTAPLDPAVLLSVMQRELPGARIEILNFSRAPAPEGILEFPRSGLRAAPGGGFWNGLVRYAGNRRFMIWARVKVLVASRRVVARERLKAGTALNASLLSEETCDGLPDVGFAVSVDRVAGMVLRRQVAAGEAIRTGWLEPPKLILRGDTVSVEVQRGGARLELEGRAEASGSAGETIPILNPLTHRRFRARVESKGRVSVEEGNS
jgi:flagella basal body P-ring formation protein FlgA